MALILCPDCGRDVSSRAAACPNCGYPINPPEKSTDTQPAPAETAPPPAAEEVSKKNGCLKGVLAVLLTGVLIGVGLFLEKGSPQVSDIAPTVEEVAISASQEEEYVARMGREKYEAAADKVRRLPRLTAIQLVRFFEANEIAADKQYKGQEVIVLGLVADVSKSLLGAPKITIRANGKQKTMSVALKRKEEDAAAKINKGDRVTLKGVVTRSITGKVGLKNSTFFDESDPLGD